MPPPLQHGRSSECQNSEATNRSFDATKWSTWPSQRCWTLRTQACRCRDGDLATNDMSAVVCTKLSFRHNHVQLGRIELVQPVDGEPLRLITMPSSAALDTADANSSFDLVKLQDKDAFVFCNSSISLTLSTRLQEESDINAALSPCEWSSSTLASYDSFGRSAIKDSMSEATSLNPCSVFSSLEV